MIMCSRKAMCEKKTAEMEFTHSSRKGWRILRHLGEVLKPIETKSNMDPVKIASIIKEKTAGFDGLYPEFIHHL